MISDLVVKALFSIFSFAIAVSDIKTCTVSRIVFVLAFPVFFVLCLLSENPHSPLVLATGALLGLLAFLAAYFISGERLGLADVWYSAIIGLVLGPLWWFQAVFCACIAGIVYMLASKRRSIPFIPFMALGSAAAIIFHFF
jgi:prepilin signal peptidase PulO-like enzyme (type II secretory pathway)